MFFGTRTVADHFVALLLSCSCKRLPSDKFFALPSLIFLGVVLLFFWALFFSIKPTFRSSRLIFLTSPSKLPLLSLRKPLFRGLSFRPFPPSAPWLFDTNVTTLKYRYTLNKRRFPSVSAIVPHASQFFFASLSEEQILLMNREVFEREIIFVCSIFVPINGARSITSLFIATSGDRQAHHDRPWRVYKMNPCGKKKTHGPFWQMREEAGSWGVRRP